MRHSHVTMLGRVIGTEEKMDLTALVHAVKSACQVETHHPELPDEEVEKLYSLSGLEACRRSQKHLRKYNLS